MTVTYLSLCIYPAVVAFTDRLDALKKQIGPGQSTEDVEWLDAKLRKFFFQAS